MRAEVAAIERLLKAARLKVKRSPVWERICEENGVGRVIGRDIHFTADEKQRLRAYVQSQYGIDPQYDSRVGGRMAMALQNASEKLSSDSVFGQLIVFATAGNTTVRVNGENFQTPRGSVCSVLPDHLDIDDLQTRNLVIIENGGVMPFWAELQLPGAWQDSVILYRGHRENVRNVVEIVSKQPADKLAWFFDFDPAGLALALEQGKGSTLVPVKWRELSRYTPFNQPKVHHKQSVALKRLKGLAAGELRAIAEHMANEELAVMQEHLTRRQMPLVALSITR
ncbi:hypothetical protein [Marinobacter sp. 2_MG-2023]|uniref:DUF7281 domain-containing protein n=1 Tax=Marinobacter sp. 2_MG-2023 TaxID=3062679 RepID=UPI0026E1FFF5|nr:hypothetical protein [Marinobacter sp. 2_MG-2023]MDO6443634.1 hypothetical protein [Marinobacter sp. 2_MG-2023]